MTAMTPMKKLIQRGKQVLVVDWADTEKLVATCESVEDAQWVAHGLSGWHGTSLELQADGD